MYKCSPSAPLGTNASICYNNPANLSATGTGTLSWYNVATGGTYLGSGTNFITPKLTKTTTYYVQDSTCWGSSIRTAILVTVNPLPTVTASASDSTVCPGNSVTLMGEGAAAYLWTAGVTDG